MKYQRGRKEPRRSEAGLAAAERRLEEELPRCSYCADVWPCPQAGGEHYSVAELRARVKAQEERKHGQEWTNNTE